MVFISCWATREQKQTGGGDDHMQEDRGERGIAEMEDSEQVLLQYFGQAANEFLANLWFWVEFSGEGKGE